MASQAVAAAFRAKIGETYQSLPVFYPNEGVDTPSDGTQFLSIQYPVSSEECVGLGGVGHRTFRERGTIRIVLSVPRGLDKDGMNAALVLIESMRGLLRAQIFGGVTCEEASPPVSNDDNDAGAYWKLSFAVPYYFDIFA